METISERRRRKLQGLVDKRGLAKIADAAGLSAAALDQVLKGTLMKPKLDGTRSAKSLGDLSARKIEDALELGRGWFDADDLATANGAQTAPDDSRPEADSFTDALEVIAKALTEVDLDTRESVAQWLSKLALDPSKVGITSQRLRALLNGTFSQGSSADDEGKPGSWNRVERGIGPNGNRDSDASTQQRREAK